MCYVSRYSINQLQFIEAGFFRLAFFQLNEIHSQIIVIDIYYVIS